MTDELTVGAAAELTGVSVRTLHYWDHIGLVVPAGRTWSDYRLYDAAAIDRIRQVLVFRELGLPLSDIREVLDNPTVDLRALLERQHTRLSAQIGRLQQSLTAVNKMKEVLMTKKNLTPEEQARIASPEAGAQWQAEAEQRWGDTEEWDSAQKVKESMTDRDWDHVRAETEQLEADLAAAMSAGVAPGDTEANALAERHRESIGRWFATTHAKQVLISRGYLADPRFRKHYDARAEGLAEWLVEVIAANARAHGVDPDSAEWR